VYGFERVLITQKIPVESKTLPLASIVLYSGAMQLYIDANIYLEYFRENSAERLQPLRILEKLIKSKKINLLLPIQTKQEYFRNRRKIAEGMRAALIKQSKLSSLIPAVIDTNRKEVKAILQSTKKLNEAYKKLIAKYDAEVTKEKTDADILLKSIFEKAITLEETDVLVARAYQRYMKGNPPRKSDHSYGDAITWEALLANATNDNLAIVTKDSDYMEISKGEQILNTYLYVEWRIKTKKKKTVKLYRSLAEFVNTLEDKKAIKEEIVEKEKEGVSRTLYTAATGRSIFGTSMFDVASLNVQSINSEGIGIAAHQPSTIFYCPFCGQENIELQMFGGHYLCKNPLCGKQFDIPSYFVG
jgi:predicted RNA-binding Zn-ribbon protein involved in translation (DUF1610 family)